MAIIEETSSCPEIQHIETASDQTSQRNVGWIEGPPMAIIEELSSCPEIQQFLNTNFFGAAMDNLLEWLQETYKKDFCNGDWEHIHGVTIDTIDSPGWYFKFDLKETDLENVNFDEVFLEIDEHNWYQCWKTGGVFHGWGGASNLTDILAAFRDWYEKQSN